MVFDLVADHSVAPHSRPTVSRAVSQSAGSSQVKLLILGPPSTLNLLIPPTPRQEEGKDDRDENSDESDVEHKVVGGL